MSPVITLPADQLARLGLRISDTIHYQLPPDELVRHCLRRKEGVLNDTGALLIRTGAFTGRSPKDRYLVKDEVTTAQVDWNDFNQPMDPAHFHRIYVAVTTWLNQSPELFIRDAYVCADPRHRLNLRIVNETPSGNLFAHNMFLRPAEEELEDFRPDWQILAAPGLSLDPATCGTRGPNAVVISFRHKLILVAGTGYTGEIKKGSLPSSTSCCPGKKTFSACTARLTKVRRAIQPSFSVSAVPARLPSAPIRPGSSSATTNMAGPADNIFNFEGGCYAKCIHLSEEKEPDIFQAIRPGALVENVKFFPGTDRINFDDGSITENTRVSYPFVFIGNALEPSVSGVPENIFFLTCDAYGVLPPISRLSPGQAMYQFISGYTAKVAGTETGITEPKPTFSACFGAPFLPCIPAAMPHCWVKRSKSMAPGSG
jgi:phosphoenolpyruvate carboxykinase (ATP)